MSERRIRTIRKEDFPQAVFSLLDRLEGAGFESWIVGGAVRDACLGLAIHDVDIASSAQPDQIEETFSDCRTIDVGKSFGTVRVVWKESVYEITTYRAERGYSDGRHPDQVSYSDQVEDDLCRRDFTMNAMAWHPDRGILDLYGGREDLKKGILNSVGDPDIRIREDGLRMLRAIRFAARYGLDFTPPLLQAIKDHHSLLKVISRERCLEEMDRILLGNRAEWAMTQLESCGLMVYLVPALAGQETYFSLLEALPEDLDLRWAGLLLPLGGKEAKRTMKDLRASNARQDRVSRACAYTKKVIDQDLALPKSRSQVQVQLNQWGLALKDGLILLTAWAKTYGSTASLDLYQAMGYLQEVLDLGLPWRIQDLALNGQDLIEMGMDQGEEIGQTLVYLLKEVMAGRLANNKEDLQVGAAKFLSL